MRTLTLVGTTAATAMAVTMLSAPSALAAPTAPAAAPVAKGVEAGDSIAIQAKGQIKCGKGYGGNAVVNFTWKSAGSTTIYFNNHCKKRKKITATVVQRRYESGIRGYKYWCRKFDTNGQTDGKKKFETEYYKVWKIARGHTVKNLPGKYGKKTSCKAR